MSLDIVMLIVGVIAGLFLGLGINGKLKHVHNYNKLVSDVAMENNTNQLVLQCKCGAVKVEHCHRESEFYKSIKCK